MFSDVYRVASIQKKSHVKTVVSSTPFAALFTVIFWLYLHIVQKVPVTHGIQSRNM
mgnify:CR=1 FL=1